MWWWVWLIAAVVLLAGELMTSGFFLFWFAMGALGASGTAAFTSSMPIQISVFILISGVLLFFSRQLGERMGRGKPDINTNASALIGKSGIVTREILPHQKGMVDVNGQEWSCVSEDPILIPEGSLVIIESLQGVTLKVVPADNRKAG